VAGAEAQVFQRQFQGIRPRPAEAGADDVENHVVFPEA
jgi:hypothetical protein